MFAVKQPLRRSPGGADVAGHFVEFGHLDGSALKCGSARDFREFRILSRAAEQADTWPACLTVGRSDYDGKDVQAAAAVPWLSGLRLTDCGCRAGHSGDDLFAVAHGYRGRA